MRPRERWLAAVKLLPVDRLPFWPKLDAAYPPAQQPPFNGMSLAEIHAFIGSDQHVWLPACIRTVRSRTSVETITRGGERVTLYKVSGGKLERRDHWDAPSQSWHPVQFPVRTVEDVKILAEIFADAAVEPNSDALAKTQGAVKSLGDNTVIAASIGTSPLMEWVEWLAGIENAHYMLADAAEEVEGLFAVMQKRLVRTAEVAASSCPADLLYLVENTSTTLISPLQYERYCFPHVSECGRIIRSAGRLFVLHMCGRLKALLPLLAEIPADAFEAFTSPTLGDTTLLDGRAACPDKCLIGGTNAVLWTKPAETIIAQVEKDLDALPHHRGIVVTSAGVMPPLCTPQTIKTVCGWLKNRPSCFGG